MLLKQFLSYPTLTSSSDSNYDMSFNYFLGMALEELLMVEQPQEMTQKTRKQL